VSRSFLYEAGGEPKTHTGAADCSTDHVEMQSRPAREAFMHTLALAASAPKVPPKIEEAKPLLKIQYSVVIRFQPHVQEHCI